MWIEINDDCFVFVLYTIAKDNVRRSHKQQLEALPNVTYYYQAYKTFLFLDQVFTYFVRSKKVLFDNSSQAKFGEKTINKDFFFSYF